MGIYGVAILAVGMYRVPAPAVGLYRIPVDEYEGPPAVGMYGVPTLAVGMYGVPAVGCDAPPSTGAYGILAVEGGELVILGCAAIKIPFCRRLVFITPYKRKNWAAFQKKMKIFSQPENHRLRRLHGLGQSANKKVNERTEERSSPKKRVCFLCCLLLEETRRRHACHYGPVLLRRQGGDNLFEARVAAQRVPPRQELQFTIAKDAWRSHSNKKLFAGQLFVASPRGD